MPLDEAQEIFTEHLENHAYVDAIWTFVSEVVEEGNDVRAAGVSVRVRARRR